MVPERRKESKKVEGRRKKETVSFISLKSAHGRSTLCDPHVVSGMPRANH